MIRIFLNRLFTNRVLALLGILVATVGVVVTIYVYTTPIKSFEMKAEIIESKPLVTVHEPIPNFKMYLKNEEISGLYLTIIKIWNSGQKDIPKDYFLGPINIQSDTEILEAFVTNQSSDSFLTWEKDTVTLSPNVFKTTDFVTVRLLTSSEPNLSFSGNSVKDVIEIVVHKD